MPKTKGRGLPNISNLSVAQLNDLISHAQSMLSAKKDEARAETISKLRAMAASEGFSFEELMGKGPGGRRQRSDKGIKLKPKYVGPNGETYTGRGPTPGWLKALEAKGHKRDRYLA
jgi:DNA-binding protein H-NS